MITDDQLQSFLKGYADNAKDHEALKGYLPLRPYVDMAGGCCAALDKNGNPIATFHIGHFDNGEAIPYTPSVPVMPHAIGFCSLFCKMINALLEPGRA